MDRLSLTSGVKPLEQASPYSVLPRGLFSATPGTAASRTYPRMTPGPVSPVGMPGTPEGHPNQRSLSVSGDQSAREVDRIHHQNYA